jgi:hypothetical protein
MNCDESREKMMDALYGEDPEARWMFAFFKHLKTCEECNQEYLELLETRQMLGQWELFPAEAGTEIPRNARPSRRFSPPVRWWPALLKIAAGFLILFGVLTIFQQMGYLGGKRLVVSEQQLTEMIQDMILVNQARERQLMGQLLVHMKEDLQLERASELQQVQEYLMSLEERYLETLERNEQYWNAALSQ